MKAQARSSDDDRAALAAIFEASYSECVRFAIGMFGDRGRAEEAVQDAFLRLWSRPPALRDAGAARSYVLRTIANMGRGRDRRDRRGAALATSTRDQPHDVDLALVVDVRRALATLPPRRRACVLMRFVLDLTEQQTADALGITVGTVKSQTHKALRQLQPYFGDVTDDGEVSRRGR